MTDEESVPGAQGATDTACLLVHGYAGGPFDLEHFVPRLKALGCHTELPTLPGHAASIPDFRKTFFADWLGRAETILQQLLPSYKKVFLIGFSMGASICMTLASRYPVAGTVAMSTPWQAYRLFPPKRSSWMVLTPLLKYIRPEIALPPPRPESRAIAPFQGYEGPLCLPQLHSLDQGLRAMRSVLRNVTCPLLMMHDLHDKVCLPENAVSIAKRCRSKDLTLTFTTMQERVTNHHMITTHRETRDFVLEESVAFVKRLL